MYAERLGRGSPSQHFGCKPRRSRPTLHDEIVMCIHCALGSVVACRKISFTRQSTNRALTAQLQYALMMGRGGLTRLSLHALPTSVCDFSARPTIKVYETEARRECDWVCSRSSERERAQIPVHSLVGSTHDFSQRLAWTCGASRLPGCTLFSSTKRQLHSDPRSFRSFDWPVSWRGASMDWVESGGWGKVEGHR